MTNRKLLREWIAWLNRRWPTRLPVRVMLCAPTGSLTDSVGMSFAAMEDGHVTSVTIKIRNNLTVDQTMQTLWHEWAHVLRWHISGGTWCEERDSIFGAIKHEIETSWLLED
jgi:hypothetical protein